MIKILSGFLSPKLKIFYSYLGWGESWTLHIIAFPVNIRIFLLTSPSSLNCRCWYVTSELISHMSCKHRTPKFKFINTEHIFFLDSGYGSKSVPCSTISKEASYCSKWEELQRCTAKDLRYAESLRAWTTQSQIGCLYQVPPFRAQRTIWRGRKS